MAADGLFLYILNIFKIIYIKYILACLTLPGQKFQNTHRKWNKKLIQNLYNPKRIQSYHFIPLALTAEKKKILLEILLKNFFPIYENSKFVFYTEECYG